MGFERPVGDICAILRLDGAAQDRLEALRTAAGAPPAALYAHVTLAHYCGLEKAAAMDWAAQAAADWRPFSVRFSSAGLLTPSCAACFLDAEGPLRTSYLALHRRLDDCCDRWTSLAAGLWRPHCSLVTEPEADYPSLESALQACFQPFAGRVAALELSQILPEGFDVFASWQLETECLI